MNARREEVLEFLRAAQGLDYTAQMVGTRFRVSPVSMRVVLNELADEGHIRRVDGIRNPRYYVPTPAVLAAEQRVLAPPEFRPLRVDRARIELYERLRLERVG